MELHYDEIGCPRLKVKTKDGKGLSFEPNNVCFMGWAINKKTKRESYQIYTAPYEESEYKLFELSEDTFDDLFKAMKDFIKDGMFEISVNAYGKKLLTFLLLKILSITQFGLLVLIDCSLRIFLAIQRKMNKTNECRSSNKYRSKY